MTHYIKRGNTFTLSDESMLDIHQKLPVGNYLIKQDPFGGLYLETIEDFVSPKKRYGDNIKNTKRIIGTFLDREKSTGVMLTGEKGSGKSLLAKTVAMAAAEQDIPTIVINAPWCGDKFNSFIQSITHPCVILFDEFEKVYDREQQEQILTLLDGVFPTKKLFILTCNDKYRIDSHMKNRPGRIFYMIEFNGLDIGFIREYCEDNLKNKEHIDKICKISALFNEFNFDCLASLVEEMNRYDETPQEAMKMLNAKPEFSDKAKYKVGLVYKGVPIEEDKLCGPIWDGNPLQEQIDVSYYAQDKDGEDEWTELYFRNKDLVKLDGNTGTFTFEDGEGYRLTLTKERNIKFDYLAF